MSKLLRQNFFIVEVIAEASSHKFILSILKDPKLKLLLLKILPEIAVNLLEFNLPLTKSETLKIKSNTKILQQLAAKKILSRQLQFIQFCCSLVVRHKCLIGLNG